MGSSEPRRRRPRGEEDEASLRGLVGGGSSQLDPVRAMRARDVSRPQAAPVDQPTGSGGSSPDAS